MQNVILLKFLLKLYPNQKVAQVGFRSTGIRPFVSKGDKIGYNIVTRNEIQIGGTFHRTQNQNKKIFWIPYRAKLCRAKVTNVLRSDENFTR